MLLDFTTGVVMKNECGTWVENMSDMFNTHHFINSFLPQLQTGSFDWNSWRRGSVGDYLITTSETRKLERRKFELVDVNLISMTLPYETYSYEAKLRQCLENPLIFKSSNISKTNWFCLPLKFCQNHIHHSSYYDFIRISIALSLESQPWIKVHS